MTYRRHAQLYKLHRIAYCWLQPDKLSACEVTERLLVDKVLLALSQEERKALGMLTQASVLLAQVGRKGKKKNLLSKVPHPTFNYRSPI